MPISESRTSGDYDDVIRQKPEHGEAPQEMKLIEQALTKADLYVAIGTSGVVYPAADFVKKAKTAGAETLEINAAMSEVSSEFDDIHRGPATQIVPAWVDQMLQ